MAANRATKSGFAAEAQRKVRTTAVYNILTRSYSKIQKMTSTAKEFDEIGGEEEIR